MIITGIAAGFIPQKENETRPVDIITQASAQSSYYQDGESERTKTPEFNRKLQEEQRKLMEQEKKLRDMRNSDDMRLVYEQLKKDAKPSAGNIVDAFR